MFKSIGFILYVVLSFLSIENNPFSERGVEKVNM